jgi:hypothetical protein
MLVKRWPNIDLSVSIFLSVADDKMFPGIGGGVGGGGGGGGGGEFVSFAGGFFCAVTEVEIAKNNNNKKIEKIDCPLNNMYRLIFFILVSGTDRLQYT